MSRLGLSIRILERPFVGGVIIEWTDTLQGTVSDALWTEITLRKNCKCPISGADLRKGEKAYRPVGNQMYRYQRIAPAVIEDRIA